MWLSFLRKSNKYKQYITSLEDVSKYMKIFNREIQIDTLTPQIADNIDGLIRFWNLADDELIMSLAEREPIKIYINSLGGSLEAAITIMNSIKISKTPVYTFNTGCAYKESFLIFLAGHKRHSYTDATFMYSDTIFQKTSEEDNESTFYNKNTLLTKIANNMKTFIIENTGITESQYDKHCKNEWWFSAEDAFKLHICNEISRSHYHYIAKNKWEGK